MFNSKIKKEYNEEFRDIFTYSNFKKNIVENVEIKTQLEVIKAENKEIKE